MSQITAEMIERFNANMEKLLAVTEPSKKKKTYREEIDEIKKSLTLKYAKKKLNRK